MRRLPVDYRPEADADLADIFHYVLHASQNVVIAEGFVQRIKARCDLIGNAPLGGRAGDDLEPGLRTIAFERSTVIAYHAEPERVTITNVFYGGRDFEMLYRTQRD